MSTIMKRRLATLERVHQEQNVPNVRVIERFDPAKFDEADEEIRKAEEAGEDVIVVTVNSDLPPFPIEEMLKYVRADRRAALLQRLAEQSRDVE